VAKKPKYKTQVKKRLKNVVKDGKNKNKRGYVEQDGRAGETRVVAISDKMRTGSRGSRSDLLNMLGREDATVEKKWRDRDFSTDGEGGGG